MREVNKQSDRHPVRHGYSLRSIKKKGAGKYNWGDEKDTGHDKIPKEETRTETTQK